MCGRFTLRSSPRELAEHFKLPEVPQLPARYNIAPSQPVLALRYGRGGHRELAELRWGLIPFWAGDADIGHRMINARAETVATKPAYRDAFRERRCLILADGFYEWQQRGKQKQPFYFRLKEDGPLALAGIWDRWKHGGDGPIESCSIIVTDANEVVSAIHDRMPVIIDPSDYERWLRGETTSPDALQDLLHPYDSEAMIAYPVRKIVNSPHNDSPQCIEPAPPENLLFE